MNIRLRSEVSGATKTSKALVRREDGCSPARLRRVVVDKFMFYAIFKEIMTPVFCVLVDFSYSIRRAANHSLGIEI